VFDTATTMVLYADSKETADNWAVSLHEELKRYHQLFTIYDSYDSLTNIKSINDAAGESVSVSSELISLLEFGKQAHTVTSGKVNMALGSVLKLWHTARQTGKLPEIGALQQANGHTGISNVEYSRENNTVILKDKELSLDVGAFAKGYAAQKVADYGRTLGITSAILSVGGNVVTIGDKNGTPFVIGIEDPKGVKDYVARLEVKNASLVTSGDYQRYITVDGKRYHHLIDPKTLQPATYFASVSVLGPDSGFADVLSTALFLMPQDEGMKLLEKQPDYAALWVKADGGIVYSANLENYLVTD
jgi:thiamine biosynthesis lipoprotein